MGWKRWEGVKWKGKGERHKGIVERGREKRRKGTKDTALVLMDI